jgi:hypothetical protein
VENQDAIREAGGIQLLVNSLSGGPDSKITGEVVQAIRAVTCNNVTNCNALREAGGVTWMVSLLQAGPEHQAATDAAATLTQITFDNVANQDAIREAGGIRPLLALLSGNVESKALVWAARCLSHISHNNTANRTVICEQQGTIGRLVTLLESGSSSEGARQSAEVLRCLMIGNDDRVAVSVLAALRRMGVGLGPEATFTLSDEFPELLEGLTFVVGNRLAAAVKRGNDRGHIQMALNDAIALEMPEETLAVAHARLESIAAARAEAIAARKARRTKKDSKKAGEERAAALGSSRTEKKDEEEAAAKGSAKESKDKNSNEPQASAVPSGASAMLLEAQQRLRDLELAAAVAKRARRDSAKDRIGKELTPSLRKVYTQQVLGAAGRVAQHAARVREVPDEMQESSPASLRPPGSPVMAGSPTPADALT